MCQVGASSMLMKAITLSVCRSALTTPTPMHYSRAASPEERREREREREREG